VSVDLEVSAQDAVLCSTEVWGTSKYASTELKALPTTLKLPVCTFSVTERKTVAVVTLALVVILSCHRHTFAINMLFMFSGWSVLWHAALPSGCVCLLPSWCGLCPRHVLYCCSPDLEPWGSRCIRLLLQSAQQAMPCSVLLSEPNSR
jgi:hypothetical protein